LGGRLHAAQGGSITWNWRVIHRISFDDFFLFSEKSSAMDGLNLKDIDL
jgi:hypothetical protein